MAFDFAEQDAKFTKAAAAPTTGAAASEAKQSNPKVAKKRDSSSKNENGTSTSEFGPSRKKDGNKHSPATATRFTFGSGSSVPPFGREPPSFAFSGFGATAPCTSSTNGPGFSFAADSFGAAAPCAPSTNGPGFSFAADKTSNDKCVKDFWGEEDESTPEFVEDRKLRSVAPDVIVAVGDKEYDCFKVALCCASDHFDTLFETATQENNTSRIELKDKDSKEWEIFYKTIDPLVRIGEVTPENAIDEDNAVMLTKWFYDFKMDSHLKECDVILKKKFIAATHWIDHKKLQLSRAYWKSAESKDSFLQLIDLLKHSCTYDLRQTSSVANKTFGYLLEHELQLFTTNTVKVLVELCVPINSDDDGSFVSEGKCMYLWKDHLSKFVNEHKDDLTVEMINENGMFPLLLHAYMQQSIKVKETHQFDFGQFKSH